MFRAAVFTISDSRAAGEKPDESGPAAEAWLASMGAACVHRAMVPDERDLIEAALREWSPRVDLIVTTGGTGVSPRDVTPEAVAAVIDRDLPGFGEAMRVRAMDRTPLSILSRGGAGVRGRTLIVYLPGSPAGVRDGLEIVAPAVRHVLRVLARPAGDCRADREEARVDARP
jgi:molybdenum cofactor synthesis domain-containing protein